MVYVRVIDDDGFFLTDDFVEALTEYTIETPCPAGFQRPRWDGQSWVEGATPEEIAALRPEPEPTPDERLAALEADQLAIAEAIAAIYEAILGGEET